jgi:hypothetical protein
VSKRETELKSQSDALEQARESIEDKVRQKLDEGRAAIAAEESKKAKTVAATELQMKSKEVTELRDLLARRDEKLQEAQNEQAALLRKQRELDDARRELELTVERRVQESLTEIRLQARLEAEGSLKLKVVEKEQQITSMQRQIEDLNGKRSRARSNCRARLSRSSLKQHSAPIFPSMRLNLSPKESSEETYFSVSSA